MFLQLLSAGADAIVPLAERHVGIVATSVNERRRWLLVLEKYIYII